MSAPAPNNSSTVAVWPSPEAIMSAVLPPLQQREREAHTIVAKIGKKRRTRWKCEVEE